MQLCMIGAFKLKHSFIVIHEICKFNTIHSSIAEHNLISSWNIVIEMLLTYAVTSGGTL